MPENHWLVDDVYTLAIVVCECSGWYIVFGMDHSLTKWGPCGRCGEQPALVEVDGEELSVEWQLAECM